MTRAIPANAPVRFAGTRGGHKNERGHFKYTRTEPDGSLAYAIHWSRGGLRFVRREDLRVTRGKR